MRQQFLRGDESGQSRLAQVVEPLDVCHIRGLWGLGLGPPFPLSFVGLCVGRGRARPGLGRSPPPDSLRL